MYAWFKLSNLVFKLRTAESVEVGGLDIPEMGVLGYVD
jgi:Amt family ammonium transporter